MNSNELSNKVIYWIDQNKEEIISFLQDLIRIPSINPWFSENKNISHENEVQDLIIKKLNQYEPKIDLWEPDAEHLKKYSNKPGYYAGRNFKGRPNLALTIKGKGNGKSIILTGHVDVVKPGDGWNYKPFAGTRSNNRIYGRGAVDMKGGIAAMIMALIAIMRSGLKLKGDVIIGTVVDEEAGGMGTLAFIDRGYRADGCILTEPTNMAIAPICRGILWGKIIIEGRSGHIEMGEGDWRVGGAVDAIRLAKVYLDSFDRLNKDWAIRKNHPLLPIPCQLITAQINGGEYPTAFANRAEIIFDAQYLPSEKDENWLGGKVKEEITEFVQAIAKTEPWLKEHPPKIEWLVDADCGETPIDNPFVETCINSLDELGMNKKVMGVSTHTDMGWFVNVGIPTINFGPGEMRMAHQNDESLSELDLISATKVIAQIILNWCGFERG
ncbi:ArgE/DapE family deacylase [Rectinema subterraneum]